MFAAMSQSWQQRMLNKLKVAKTRQPASEYRPRLMTRMTEFNSTPQQIECMKWSGDVFDSQAAVAAKAAGIPTKYKSY